MNKVECLDGNKSNQTIATSSLGSKADHTRIRKTRRRWRKGSASEALTDQKSRSGRWPIDPDVNNLVMVQCSVEFVIGAAGPHTTTSVSFCHGGAD